MENNELNKKNTKNKLLKLWFIVLIGVIYYIFVEASDKKGDNL
jgi:hypothetical protein